MKRHFIISIFFILMLMVRVNGQKTESQDLSKWSVSFSVSPQFEVPKYDSYAGESFLISFDNKFNYRFRDHFSLTFGLGFSFKESASLNINFNGLSYESENIFEKVYLFEFPLQINYHFQKRPKQIDPYFKIGLKNSFYYYDYESYSTQDQFKTYSIKYAILLDMGIGSYLRISDRISFIYEASIGVGINYYVPDYTYFEGLVGLRYMLK